MSCSRVIETVHGDGRLEERHHAAEIQRAQLPRRWPPLDGFSFAAQFHPIDVLGGDFYDACNLDGQTAAFYVADVSGHGLGPALITMLLRQIMVDLREDCHRDLLRSPGRTLTTLRRRLATEGLCEHFITLLYGVIHGPDRSLVYASAGHPPPLLLVGGELVESEFANGPILSPFVEPGDGWPERTIHLPPGSRVAIHTDGLTGGPLRLWLREGRHLPGEDWARRAIEVVKDSAGVIGAEDDLTLLVISAEG